MIKTAIIPVAGLGTRFLPATKAQPKEMLPVVDKPVIQYLVEEAVEGGIKEIIFVTSVGKRALEDHFDRNFELEYRLQQKQKEKELEEVSRIAKLAKFAFVRQSKPLGDGHAILCALPFIEAHQPVVVIFGDALIWSKGPSIARLIHVFERYQKPLVAVKEVPKQLVSRYGIIDGEKINTSLWKISRVVEKPSFHEAPSRLAIVGRYILTPELCAMIAKTPPDADGEIHLANTISDYLRVGGVAYADVVRGIWYDCGNKLEYLKAQVEYGLRHPEVGKEFGKYLMERKNAGKK